MAFVLAIAALAAQQQSDDVPNEFHFEFHRRLAWAKLGQGNEDAIIAAFVVGGLLICCLFCALLCFKYGCLDMDADGLDMTRASRRSSDDGRVQPEFKERSADQDDELDKIKRRLKAKGKGRVQGTILGDPEDLDKEMLMTEREKTLRMRDPDLG